MGHPRKIRNLLTYLLIKLFLYPVRQSKGLYSFMLVPNCFSTSSGNRKVYTVSCQFQIVSLPRQEIKMFVQPHVSSKLFLYLVRQSKSLYSFMLFPNCFSTSSGNLKVNLVNFKLFLYLVGQSKGLYSSYYFQIVFSTSPDNQKVCTVSGFFHIISQYHQAIARCVQTQVNSKLFLHLVRQSKDLYRLRLFPNCFSNSSGNRKFCTVSCYFQIVFLPRQAFEGLYSFMLVPICFSTSSGNQMVCTALGWFQFVSLPRQAIKLFVQFHVSSKLFLYFVR